MIIQKSKAPRLGFEPRNPCGNQLSHARNSSEFQLKASGVPDCPIAA